MLHMHSKTAHVSLHDAPRPPPSNPRFYSCRCSRFGQLLLPPLALGRKLARVALERLFHRNASRRPLPTPPAQDVCHVPVDQTAVLQEGLDAQDGGGRIAVLDLQDTPNAGSAVRERGAELGAHARPQLREAVVVEEDLQRVLAVGQGLRGREVGGEVGGRVVVDVVEAADLGEEGVAERRVGVEVVAGEEDGGIDAVAGEVGEEGVVEHELHEGGSEGSAFGDVLAATRLDVGEVDFRRALLHAPEISNDARRLRLVFLASKEVLDALLTERNVGLAPFLVFLFQILVRTDEAQLIDDAVH